MRLALAPKVVAAEEEDMVVVAVAAEEEDMVAVVAVAAEEDEGAAGITNDRYATDITMIL
ncbi:MAG: hypothetical protein V1930_03695 [Pseudomonadota bacterium]